MKTPEEILGQIVDISVKLRPAPAWQRKAEYYCMFCDDTDSHGNVHHKHGCVIAQAKEILRDRQS